MRIISMQKVRDIVKLYNDMGLSITDVTFCKFENLYYRNIR